MLSRERRVQNQSGLAADGLALTALVTPGLGYGDGCWKRTDDGVVVVGRTTDDPPLP